MKKFLTSNYPYFPITGMVLYLAMFTYTTTLYPGGSMNYPEMAGHSFFHNLLCDLNGTKAINGALNPARPMSIASHIVLSITMILFFYTLPDIFEGQNRNTKLVRIFGVLSMIVFILMFTEYHDRIVVLVAVLGTLALVPFFIEVLKYPNAPLKRWAYLCYLMSVVVFVIFITKIGYYYLPFLQKVTFVLDAVWVIWVCLIVNEKNKIAARHEVTTNS
ncbi:MAG: hypothetical protein AAGF85_16415 [Bacteroidota bacterium]